MLLCLHAVIYHARAEAENNKVLIEGTSSWGPDIVLQRAYVACSAGQWCCLSGSWDGVRVSASPRVTKC